MKKFIIITILALLILPLQTQAVTSLSNVSFDVESKLTNTMTTWTMSFALPQDSSVGHLLISLSGYQPDFSQATMSVSGLPTGTSQLGKSNPSCSSNCDDIRFYFVNPVNIKANQEISLTINNIKNPEQDGQTGINFINIFSSKYPDRDLAFSASDYFVTIVENEEDLIPDSVTDEGEKDIKKVTINPLFYKQGSMTTKLDEIEDPANVEDLTFDLIDKVKVVFKEPVDLSNEESVHFIENLADYMTFEHVYFWIDHQIENYFNVPIEITFYDLPYIWEPNVIKDDQFILEQEEIENFHSAVVNEKSQISFIIEEAGGYRVIPNLVLYIEDNTEIKQKSNNYLLTGRISDPFATVQIKLNGHSLSSTPEIDPRKGDFTFSVELTEGANLIEINAQSNYGEIPKVTRIIQFKPTTSNDNVEEVGGIFDPLYYIIGFLIILAIVLIFAIKYLVKKK